MDPKIFRELTSRADVTSSAISIGSRSRTKKKNTGMSDDAKVAEQEPEVRDAGAEERCEQLNRYIKQLLIGAMYVTLLAVFFIFLIGFKIEQRTTYTCVASHEQKCATILYSLELMRIYSNMSEEDRLEIKRDIKNFYEQEYNDLVRERPQCESDRELLLKRLDFTLVSLDIATRVDNYEEQMPEMEKWLTSNCAQFFDAGESKVETGERELTE